ncbi:hypothetical protein [Candidatus Kuenenia stuttgartiensis]|uniref:hypothetical protein n=1 Tax=Kuenenia stuttgartiensis TaxID=174633 RepID=UPI00146AEA05|nr:hypothetical protein [Candidatus Kuenenia stuttgartiensis]
MSPAGGVQGVDRISPSIQLPLYYENKFAPLSHADRLGKMNFAVSKAGTTPGIMPVFNHI